MSLFAPQTERFFRGAKNDIAWMVMMNRQETCELLKATTRHSVDALLDDSIRRSVDWFGAQQSSDGHWCAELEGDTILESEYVLLLAWLGEHESEVAHQAARYILSKQQPNGGWSQFPGGELDISVSVKAYFALKLTGHDPDADYMRRASTAIREHGGADSVNSFTRFYLALLGQISFDQCPAVPPEMVLLPNWSPINVYRISAWSRTIFVPLAIVWAYRPTSDLDSRFGIRELFLQEPENWPPLSSPEKQAGVRASAWRLFFRSVDSALKLFERLRFRPLRRRALRVAEAWILERFQASDGLGAIFPPIVWSVIALRCRGYSTESTEVSECLQQLSALILEEDDTVRLQPCKSPVWDTAISLRALAAADSTSLDDLIRCVDWILDKEVQRVGDWRANVDAEPAGWFFEYENAFYPDVDDTIMVMMGLQEVQATNAWPDSSHQRDSRINAACRRALQWILAMQNSDGGWGAFDKDNDLAFLCHVPFADHNAMIDPSTPDITARVLEALAQYDYTIGHPVVDRAVAFLRKTQEADGSWYGRWGVNYIYGTWQVVSGLARIGLSRDDSAIQHGVQWLLDHQLPCGGWGESARSYEDASLKGCGPVTASQTAWALLGLIDAGHENHPAVRKGIRYLCEQQLSDGSWHETEFTGTGFPRVFYLRYHMYPMYFPLLALARWKQAARPV